MIDLVVPLYEFGAARLTHNMATPANEHQFKGIGERLAACFAHVLVVVLLGR